MLALHRPLYPSGSDIAGDQVARGVANRDERVLAGIDKIIFDATRGLCDAPEGCRLIPLTRGYFAVVDEADFARSSALKWHAQVKPGGNVYAVRVERVRSSSGTVRALAVRLHRCLVNAPADIHVDHRDGNGLNNRIKNLRGCSPQQNCWNKKKTIGAQRFKGISVYGNTFKARICINGKTITVGAFATDIEAALAYDAAARQLFGEFANLNFPDFLPADPLPGIATGRLPSHPLPGTEGGLVADQENVLGACRHPEKMTGAPANVATQEGS